MSDYNGWPNRETWAVNLWVGNDYETYLRMSNYDVSTPEKCKYFVYHVIDSIVLQSIRHDIHPKSLKDVDWNAICEAWNEE